MGTRKPKMAESLKKIHKILMEKWDSIGVRDVPEAQDEYDSYILQLYGLLRKQSSAKDIIDYLYKIETEWMGLSSSKEALHSVVQELLGLDVSKDEIHQ